MIKRVIFLVSFICLSQLLMAQRDSTYFGVSLSGAEWGQPLEAAYYPSTDLLDYYQTKGLRLIRLPIMWERIQPTLSSSLDATELDKLTTFIDAVAARNMKVIVDIHNYARYNGNTIGALTGVTTADVQDLWTRLANELKSKSCIWGYGIMNEPHDMASIAPWKDIAQAIITGIRTVDQWNTIIVGGDSWSSAERWPTYSDNLKNLTDPNTNLIFEAHCYFDIDASGRYINSYDADGVTTATGVNRVKPFVNWLKTNNLKGFIGEYGVPNDDPRWLPVLDTFLVYLKANHIGGAYWDCSNLNCDPIGSTDAVQMAVLEKYATIIPGATVDPGTGTGTLTVSSNDVTISAVANSTATLNVFSNISWHTSIPNNEPWITIIPKQIIQGNATLTFLVAGNNTGQARSATLLIMNNNITLIKSVTITQEAGSTTATGSATLTVSTNTANIAGSANSTVSINVLSNTNWKTIGSTTEMWLTINPTQAISGNATVTVVASENTTGFPRTATLYVVATANDASSQTITITQAMGTGNVVAELDKDNIFVYPNPATSSFTINNVNEASVEVYSSTSQLVLKTTVIGKESISLKDISAGLYYVKIISNKAVVTKSLIVE
jgi:endoglucanase